ncbi:unnamed protein product [Microthlaspi erraticum]|uniref:Uncharacterized protein n=1 Tax=Microthlaspi erraticum TaxID=1685480 RepID=A0A6D2KCF9_9BRAS|nr:unnamed protein product [Microthlaspi erraticum]
MKLFSSVAALLLRPRAVTSLARIPTRFHKVNKLDEVMSRISSDYPMHLDTFDLLQRSVSKLFQDHGYANAASLHCLCIKLGLEGKTHTKPEPVMTIPEILNHISGAWITDGSSCYGKDYPLHKMMHFVHTHSPIALGRMQLLLQSISNMFGDSYDAGRTLHGLCVKLGIESKIHRNLITLYGRMSFFQPEHRATMLQIFQLIKPDYFYKALNSMVHAFGLCYPKDALSAFAWIVKLGTPTESNIIGLLVALKFHSEKETHLVGVNVLLLMNHYKIPVVPRIWGAIVDMYASKGLLSSARHTLLCMGKIDDIPITSFLNGCVRYGDMDEATKLVRLLEEKNVVYTLNEAFSNQLKYLGIGVDFGPNVKFTKKEVGHSFLDGPASIHSL